MKIMMVTPYFYPKVGGLENYALNIAKGLQKNGHEIFVVTSNHEGKERVEQKVQGLRVIRLPYQFKLSNTPISFRWKQEIKAIIATEKPNVINAHTPVPFIADMTERVRGRVPFVLTYHNDLVKSGSLAKALAKTYNFIFTRKTLRRSNKIIATSQYYAEKSPYLRKWQSKIAVVSPGVDLARFNPQVDKQWLKKKYPGKKIVLFVGSLKTTHMHKGVYVLLQAVAKAKTTIPNIQLVVVGSGDAIPIYTQLADELGIRSSVDFSGFAAEKDLPKYYAGADVFVLPSTTGAEGFGMVLAEAMACGTPVIGTKVGGVPFVIQNKATGLLVKPGSSAQLNKAILSMLNDRGIYNQLSSTASKYAFENFAWKHQIANLETIFNKVNHQKIICVIPTYPPKLGGMELVVESLNGRLVNDGYNVEVITSNIGAMSGVTYDNATKVTRLPAIEILHTPIMKGLFWQLLKLPQDSIIDLHISQVLTPEIAFMVAKIRRFPIVAHVHTDLGPSGIAGKLLPMYKKLFLGFVLRHSNTVIALNESYKELLTKKYKLPNNVTVVPNGVDERFFSSTFKQMHDGPIRILYVGRLSVEKNVDMIIEAVAKVNASLRLDIVGDGPLMQNLKEKTKLITNQTIIFHGRKSSQELVKFYQEADALVLASDYEGQPTVIMEAMASGLPVIGTNVLGIKEAIGNNGLLTEKNPIDIRETINNLAAHPTLLQELSKKSRTHAETFKWEISLQKLQKALTLL